MQEIQIINLQLLHLNCSLQQEKHPHSHKLNAYIELEYDFSDVSKEIKCYVIVGETLEQELFRVICSYQFQTFPKAVVNEIMLEEILDLLKPHIEEILAFIDVMGEYIYRVDN
jgi:hypothetical protein